MTEHAGPAARMSERYKSRTREPAARGPTAGQEQEKTEKLRAMIQILEDKLAKVSVHLLKRIILYCLLKIKLRTKSKYPGNYQALRCQIFCLRLIIYSCFFSWPICRPIFIVHLHSLQYGKVQKRLQQKFKYVGTSPASLTFRLTLIEEKRISVKMPMIISPA